MKWLIKEVVQFVDVPNLYAFRGHYNSFMFAFCDEDNICIIQPRVNVIDVHIFSLVKTKVSRRHTYHYSMNITIPSNGHFRYYSDFSSYDTPTEEYIRSKVTAVDVFANSKKSYLPRMTKRVFTNCLKKFEEQKDCFSETYYNVALKAVKQWEVMAWQVVPSVR